MGAAASVDFQVPDGALDEKFSQNLELQAAANWARIIQHANGKGAGIGNEHTHNVTDEVTITAQAGNNVYKVFRPGDSAQVECNYVIDGAINHNRGIFKTAKVGDPLPQNQTSLKKNSNIYIASEAIPVVIKLIKRSGNTVVLEWDNAISVNEAMDKTIDDLGIRRGGGYQYELIARRFHEQSTSWVPIFSGALSTPSIAVQCFECNTKYQFRCRRLIGIEKEARKGEMQEDKDVLSPNESSWLPGAWSDAISVRTGPGPPSPITRIALLEIGCSSVAFTWNPPVSDNGLPILHYIFRLFEGVMSDDEGEMIPKAYKLVSEIKMDLYSDEFQKPFTMSAPVASLSPGMVYRLSISAANRAGEGSALSSDTVAASSYASSTSFRTRGLNELSLTPWVFCIDETSHSGHYRHMASGTVATALPPGALTDEDASFKNKLSHFQYCVSERRKELRLKDSQVGAEEEEEERLIAPLVVNRANLLQDSLTLLGYSDIYELELNPIRIQFEGEQGIDNGGLAKDWFTSVAKALVDPTYRICSTYDGCVVNVRMTEKTKYKSDPTEDFKETSYNLDFSIQPVASIPIIGLNIAGVGNILPEEELETDTFRAVGILLGKAVVDDRTIGYSLDPILLKWLLYSVHRHDNTNRAHVEGKADVDMGDVNEKLTPHETAAEMRESQLPTLSDLASSDFGMYSSLKWVMEASEAELEASELTFATSRPMVASEVGANTVELIPNGSSIVVSGHNRRQFVELLFAWLVKGRYEPALSSVISGFQAVVPQNSLKYITPNELSLMLSGKPIVDIADLRKNTIYSGIKFSPTHELADWFWEVVESLDQATLSSLLLFITGSMYMPILGYSPPFNITMHDYAEASHGSGTGAAALNNDSRLPEAHTCFNQIVFPMYTNKDVLEKKLRYAVENNGNMFSIL